VPPKTYEEIDEADLRPWAFNKTRLVSFNEMTYQYWSDVETANSETFVEKITAM